MKRDDDAPDDPFVVGPDLWAELRAIARATRNAGRREADARFALDQATARLKVVEADLKYKMKRDPQTFGLDDRPTIPDIKAACEVNPEFGRAQAEADALRRDLGYAEADVRAFVDKRKALERMVELLMINYRTEREPVPRVSPDPGSRRPEIGTVTD